MTTEIFILECKEGLTEFRKTINELDMPVVDIDAAVQVIVEAIQHEDHAGNLHEAAKDISVGEGLFEQDNEECGVESRLYAATLKLGGEIKRILRYHHAYRDGVLPFTFRKFLNHDTFYLTKR